MRAKKLFAIGLLLPLLSVTSCRNEVTNPNSENIPISAEVKKKEVMKEFSKLLGKVLTDKNNRRYVVSLIHDRNDNSEAITVNALFNKDIPTEEAKTLNEYSKTSRINTDFNFFKQTVINEFNKEKKNYPILSAEIAKDASSTGRTTNEDIFDDISDFYVSQGLDVYFPYEENFDLSVENQVSLTWDPMTGQEWNSGYITPSPLNDGGHELQLAPVSYITDEYAYNYPTLVVRPAAWIGSEIVSDPNPYLSTPSNNPPSWYFQGWQGFLTGNVDHTKIMNDDVLKVTIPKIRLKEHLATFLTPTTITLARTSSDLKFDDQGNLALPLMPNTLHLLERFNIKRRDARNHNWVEVNLLWDDDWNMSEVEENMTWGSIHTFQTSLNVSGKVKVGWDKEKSKPTYEPTMDVDFSFKLANRCRLEHNNNISRRAVLTQVVGDTGAGVYNDNGVEYSIRNAGKMDYYFKPYLTKIVQ